jgi:hypothetical protein
MYATREKDVAGYIEMVSDSRVKRDDIRIGVRIGVRMGVMEGLRIGSWIILIEGSMRTANEGGITVECKDEGARRLKMLTDED